MLGGCNVKICCHIFRINMTFPLNMGKVTKIIGMFDWTARFFTFSESHGVHEWPYFEVDTDALSDKSEIQSVAIIMLLAGSRNSVHSQFRVNIWLTLGNSWKLPPHSDAECITVRTIIKRTAWFSTYSDDSPAPPPVFGWLAGRTNRWLAGSVGV